jgi:hypothetical protein
LFQAHPHSSTHRLSTLWSAAAVLAALWAATATRPLAAAVQAGTSVLLQLKTQAGVKMLSLHCSRSLAQSALQSALVAQHLLPKATTAAIQASVRQSLLLVEAAVVSLATAI